MFKQKADLYPNAPGSPFPTQLTPVEKDARALLWLAIIPNALYLLGMFVGLLLGVQPWALLAGAAAAVATLIAWEQLRSRLRKNEEYVKPLHWSLLAAEHAGVLALTSALLGLLPSAKDAGPSVDAFFSAHPYSSFFITENTAHQAANTLLVVLMVLSLVHLCLSLPQLFRKAEGPPSPHAKLVRCAGLAVPVLWYVLMNGALGTRMPVGIGMLWLVLTLGAYTLIMLLAKMTWQRQIDPSRRKGWGISLLGVLPIMGLLIGHVAALDGYFWDCTSPWWVVLTLANTALMLWPEPEKPRASLALFYGRSVTSTYLLYVLVIMAPLYLLGIPAILLFGVGLLILAPVFATLYQCRGMLAHARSLRAYHPAGRLIAVFAAGLITLPLCLILAFFASSDRANLLAALRYAQGYSAGNDSADVAGASVDTAQLNRTLGLVLHGDETFSSNLVMNFDSSESRLPIIEQLYHAITLRGMPLDVEALGRVKALFEPDPGYRPSSQNSQSSSTASAVVLESFTVETAVQGEDTYSTVHLRLENSREWDLREFRTQFALPEGAYLVDYYLTIDGVRKQGMITGRQEGAALYNRIVNTNRDPGLLYAVDGLATLRVFPFSAGEVRTTGFTLVHRDPLLLTIDGKEIALPTGSDASAQSVAAALGSSSAPLAQPLTYTDAQTGVVYLNAAAKAALPLADREPFMLYVVDIADPDGLDVRIAQIRAHAASHSIDPTQATVVALDYRLAAFPMEGPWEEQLRAAAAQGTLCRLNLSMVLPLLQEHTGERTYPCVMMLSDFAGGVLWPGETRAQGALQPESPYVSIVDSAGTNERCSLAEPTLSKRQSTASGTGALVFTFADGSQSYLPDDGEPQLLLPPGGIAQALPASAETATSAESSVPAESAALASWETALRLNARHLALRSLPMDAAAYWETYAALRRESLLARALIPSMCFLALETPEQEAAVRVQQEQILRGIVPEKQINPVNMEEPSWLWMALAGAACAAIALLRKRRARCEG